MKFTLLSLLFFIVSVHSQNLLDASTWTVGFGSVSGFSAYGITEKNQRELGLNHVGNEVVLWKSLPDDTGFQDGGFYSSYVNIDPTKTYRFSVWIKKTNSNTGTTYFGCNSYVNGQHQTLKLDGTTNVNPYFWYGDLPELNKWYLLVGYIHNSSYSSTVSLGRIYDGVTTEEVLTITDLKFSASATNLKSRAFLAYDTNSDDRQYHYEPRMEEVNGIEPSINRLLGINEGSTLVFNYDNSGSQKQRFYCSAGCQIPTPPVGRPSNDDLDNLITENNKKDDLNSENITSNNLVLYPNPTAGRISVSISNVDYHLSDFISIYNINGALVKEVTLQKKTTSSEIDISSQPSGVYFIHIHLSNGSVVTRRIIKQ